jgi:hypothetical protein
MLLKFYKPEKLRHHKEHNRMYASDINVAGTYVPNMSVEDMKEWKAKLIKGINPRVQIKKTFSGPNFLKTKYNCHAQAVIEVSTEHKAIIISSNGKIRMSLDEFNEFVTAINEAQEILGKQEKLFEEGDE